MTRSRDLAKGTFNDAVTVQGAFTSLGIDDNATSTAITIDASQNVGIGGTVTSTAFGSQLATTLFTQNVLKSSVASSAGAFIRMAVSGSNNPTYSFEDDQNTGIFTSGADTLNFSTAATERMRIDSYGRVTMPYQPSFEAQSVSNQNLTNSWSNLIFGSVQSNRGGHYNGTNGRFTAPVDGFYQFNTVFLVSKANNTRIDAILVKNGAYYSGAEYQDFSSTSTNTSVVYTSCIQLATGDYVNIGSAAHGGSGAYFYGYGILSRFSGHLVG